MYLESKVLLSKQVKNDLRYLPRHIIHKFQGWITMVELYGIREARLIAGFHDEPLKGKREGQRSIRLNRAYRAFYIETNEKEVEIIQVIEVNKHEYK